MGKKKNKTKERSQLSKLWTFARSKLRSAPGIAADATTAVVAFVPIAQGVKAVQDGYGLEGAARTMVRTVAGIEMNENFEFEGFNLQQVAGYYIGMLGPQAAKKLSRALGVQ